MASWKQRFILLFKCLVTFELLYFMLLLYFQFKADPGQSKLGKRNCGTNARFAVYCKVVISCTAIYQEHYIEVLIEISVEFEMLAISRYFKDFRPKIHENLHAKFQQHSLPSQST